VSPQPPNVSGHHRDTLRQIFAHPLSHNVEWHAVVSLLSEICPVTERSDGNVEVTVGEERFVLARPHHKDLSADEVMRVRNLLERLGFQPSAD
jgi:hypothetical protein